MAIGASDYVDHENGLPSKDEINLQRDGELDRLIADAKRWRYVRDNLVKGEPKMDGTSWWRFQSRSLRGYTVDDALDKAIDEAGS